MCHRTLNPGRPAPPRRGFTIAELLITLAIIVILLSIVIVALNMATRRAQQANTSFLMNSISQGLVRFKEDHGYLPPVLDRQRGLNRFDFLSGGEQPRTPIPPDPNDPVGPAAGYFDEMQQWYSVTSVAEFLLGYGGEPQTGYAEMGIRSPAADGVWGAYNRPLNGQARGSLAARDPAIQGRVYNPYIDLSDDQILASIGPDDPNDILYPGDQGYDDPGRALVIVDYWGQPIRYYRRPYPIAAPAQPYRRREVGNTVVGTLADVFALRPFNLGGRDDAVPAHPDAAGSDRATTELRTAEFALFSSGADRTANNDYRYDPDEFNADNIVEVGR